MTAEKLQDAIGLLPADLVAEADKLRQGKPKVIRWKRYTAMAACFALVASCAWFASVALMPSGAAEPASKYAADMAPAAAAPMEEAAPEEKAAGNGMAGVLTEEAPALDLPAAEATGKTEPMAYSFKTPLKPATACFSSGSEVALAATREELDTYLADKEWIFDFTAGKERLDSYSPEWFLEQDLLLISQLRVPEGSGCSVTAITEQEGIWQICIAYDLGTEDAETAQWHILLELDKGRIPDADTVILVYE